MNIWRESRRENWICSADNIQCTGVSWLCIWAASLPLLKLRFPNIIWGVLDVFAMPNILICSHVFQETPERKESVFGCQNGSRDLCTHTSTHSLNLFHTAASSGRERTERQSEGNLNSWQINTGWWIQLPKQHECFLCHKLTSAPPNAQSNYSSKEQCRI